MYVRVPTMHRMYGCCLVGHENAFGGGGGGGMCIVLAILEVCYLGDNHVGCQRSLGCSILCIGWFIVCGVFDGPHYYV